MSREALQAANDGRMAKCGSTGCPQNCAFGWSGVMAPGPRRKQPLDMWWSVIGSAAFAGWLVVVSGGWGGLCHRNTMAEPTILRFWALVSKLRDSHDDSVLRSLAPSRRSFHCRCHVGKCDEMIAMHNVSSAPRSLTTDIGAPLQDTLISFCCHHHCRKCLMHPVGPIVFVVKSVVDVVVFMSTDVLRSAASCFLNVRLNTRSFTLA